MPANVALLVAAERVRTMYVQEHDAAQPSPQPSRVCPLAMRLVTAWRLRTLIADKSIEITSDATRRRVAPIRARVTVLVVCTANALTRVAQRRDQGRAQVGRTAGDGRELAGFLDGGALGGARRDSGRGSCPGFWQFLVNE